MLLSKEVEVKITNFNIDYYKSIGFDCKPNSKITIDIKHLSDGSGIEIEYICDYCKTVGVKPYRKHIRGRKMIGKDCCGDYKCQVEKRKEIQLLKYGVENVMQREDVKKTLRNTMMERYGEDNIMKVDSVRQLFLGENHPNWNPDLDSDTRDRHSLDYKAWVDSVFKRDDYTCQCCNRKGVTLNAHHIYNFAEHVDLRFDVGNGVTLCEECHSHKYAGSFHSVYGIKNNTPEQLEEYIKDFKSNS